MGGTTTGAVRIWTILTAVTGAVQFFLATALRSNATGASEREELLWSMAGGCALVLAAAGVVIGRRLLDRFLPQESGDEGSAGLAATRPFATLFIASFLCLFVEIVLIRYAGSQVRVFSFYKNIPLISCFLGMGIGCFLRGGRARHALGFLAWLLPLAVVLSLGTLAASRFLGEWAAAGSSEHILGDVVIGQVTAHRALAGQAFMALFAVAMLTAMTLLFVPLGRLLGEAFRSVPRLAGYSVNIAGSLAGVATFVGLSYLHSPPVVWFAVGLLPLLWWMERGRQRAAAFLLVAVNMLAVAPSFGHTVWSPYQKLVGREEPMLNSQLNGYRIEISDVFYQVAIDLRPEAVAAYGRNPYPHYDGQFAGLPRGGRVLVVGAGTGNDVAAALRAGAGTVDAVDIDPAIVAMGRRHHPERPYDDSRVRIIFDDARSAFRRLPAGSYDAVVFGLLDSHTQLGVSSVRLDNYVFTLESLADAKRLLAPGGQLVITAATFRKWFRDRLGLMLAVTCGQPVGHRRFGVWETYSCAIADSPDPRLASLGEKATLPKDDWPFLYLPKATVPTAYLVVLALLAVASALLLHLKGVRIGRLGALEWHLFFMGAAFLLVEVHAINRLALLFGSTWLVSSVAIGLVLALILLANLAASRGLPYGIAYAGLFGSLATAYILNAGSVAGLGMTVALGFALLQVLPVFFAGIIFARSFKAANAAGPALGANMLGAVLGGWTEYASMAIGIRSLLLLALALYLASLLALLRARGDATSAPSPGTSAHGA